VVAHFAQLHQNVDHTHVVARRQRLLCPETHKQAFNVTLMSSYTVTYIETTTDSKQPQGKGECRS
jgi:hypothetical protein